MKVQDINKTTLKSDAFSTLVPLNYALRIFGLSCIYRDGTKLKYNCPIWKFSLYIFVFLAANVYSVYIKLQSIEKPTKFTFVDSMQLVYLIGYIQYVFDIISVYKYGRQSYIDYFNLYEYVDSIIGMPYYQQAKKCIRNMCIFYIIATIMSTTIELCTWTIFNFNWVVLNIYSIELLYLVMRMLAALDIIANCIQVKYRLKTIGDLLELYSYHADNSHDMVKDVIFDRVWISQDVRKFNHNDSLKTEIKCHDIMNLTRCYILLTEQSEFLNQKYGYRLLLGSSMYLMDMVLLLNMIIRILMGNMLFPNVSSYLLILSSIGRIFNYTVILFCGIHRCEQTYRQTERIVRLINHLLVNKKIGKEIRETVMELKDVIVSRPVVYHALNFFRINYATLVSMASVIVTYTIIFLQNLQ